MSSPSTRSNSPPSKKRKLIDLGKVLSRRAAQRAHNTAVAAASAAAAASDSAMPTLTKVDVSAKVDESAIREAKENQYRFSKMASRYQLGQTGVSFETWCVAIQQELQFMGLSHCLITDPTIEAPESRQRKIDAEQQATYHILLQCLPLQDAHGAAARLAITSSLPDSERTAFGAWRALRRYYLGDEQTHLQALEKQLQNMRWDDKESFAEIEARFETLLSRMDSLGQPKAEHVRKQVLMDAIMHSSHTDARGAPLFDRLNVVSKVATQTQQPYRLWLAAVRTEAQQVLQERTDAKGKPSTAGHKRKADEMEVRDVSAVSHYSPDGNSVAAASSGSNTSRPRPLTVKRRLDTSDPRTHRIYCRNWQRTGTCAYGDSCKFQHSSPAAGQGGQNRNGAQGGQPKTQQSCWQFAATGKCARAQCRFSHDRSSNKQQGAAEEEVSKVEVQREIYVVEQALQVSSTSQTATSSSPSASPHRILLDSCDSIHLTPVRQYVPNMQLLDKPVWVKGAFGSPVECRYGGAGAVPIGNATLRMPLLVYCPTLRDTLLSMVDLLRAGHFVNLQRERGTLIVQSPGEGEIASIPISYQGNVFSLHAPQDALVTTRSRAQLDNPPATPSPAPASPLVAPEPAVDEKTVSQHDPTMLAHARYGHLCGRKMGQLMQHSAADGILQQAKPSSFKLLSQSCPACATAKMMRRQFGESIEHHASAPNDVAVGDVCGPIAQETQSDGSIVKFYLSLVVDVFSRRCSARIIPSKRDASQHVKDYSLSTQTLTGKPLRRFHTDGGKEYNEAERWLEARGGKVTRTPAHTPQHNGIAERMNRTLLSTMLALLGHAKLEPTLFWREALETAVYLRNRTHVDATHGKTSHELFCGQRPDLSLCRVFGCDATVHVPSVRRDSKLAARGETGIFIGYDDKHPFCFRIRVGTRTIVSRDVVFHEQHFTADRAATPAATAAASQQPADNTRTQLFVAPRSGEDSSPGHQSESDDDSAQQQPAAMDVVEDRTLRRVEALERRDARQPAAHSSSSASSNPPRYPARVRTHTRQTGLNPDDFGQFALSVSQCHAASAPSQVSTHIPPNSIREGDVAIPSTRKAALRSAHSAQWQAAMEAEMASMREHQVYTLTTRPSGVNVVSCKWVFAVKCKDGWVVRFKARLVARGFSQQPGVDFGETFAPVLKYKTLRLILALIATRDLEFELMDVQTAYLNALLKEVVYMAQPDGFTSGDGNHLVWRLLKAIYGLKQAGREWNQHLDTFIVTVLFFTRCVADPCLYTRKSRSGRLILLSVYVDDIPSAFATEDRAEWEEIKATFFSRFAIKFLGDADWLLNLRITRHRPTRTLYLDQRAYTESMLEELQFDQCAPLSHPGAPEELSRAGCPATAEETAEMRLIPYRRAVGALAYLANTSRPDIAHAVNLVSQFSQNPGAIHWRAVKAILRYLRGTSGFALVFAPAESTQAAAEAPVSIWCDASWAGCKDTRRSTSGYLLRFQGCWIDWRCHKQETVALSSCEAEYMALTDAATEASWIRTLLAELESATCNTPVSTSRAAPIPILHCDSQSAIALAQNDVHHSRSKHIDLRHHFIRDEMTAGRITLKWVSSQDQVADILTKTLLPRIFIRLRDSLVSQLPERPATRH
jgi:transposase InsO family protein